MRLTAEQVYEKLLDEEDILNINGQIRFNLGNVGIVVKQRDVVGNIMQEWLKGWFDKNGIDYKMNPNSQMPPDYFLNPDDQKSELLEVKAFNYDASPGFDIADFNAYQAEIIKQPYMLHAKYLIFGYRMMDNGDVVIVNMWLKSVWEICRRMEAWSLNLQVKDKVVHKIRPCVWYSTKKVAFSPFKSLEDFVSAIEECVYQNPKTHNLGGTWKNSFLESYCRYYGINLSIPRWSEIADSYDNKKKGK